MSYEAWRISYQSSEQAAQAAYEAWQQAREERDAMAAHIERLKEAGEAAALEAPAVTQAAIAWGEVCEQTPAVSLAHRDNYKTALGWEDSANTLELMECPKGARHFRDSAAKHLRYKAGKLREQAKATPCPPH